MKYIAITLIVLLLAMMVSGQQPPYPRSPVIKSIGFDWSSHLSKAPGSDNWPFTWADDDNQYTVWGDGGGFGGTNSLGRSSIGVARIEGSQDDFRATNVWGGYQSENQNEVVGKSYGIVCVKGVLYMWVGMFDPKNNPFNETKIAYSDDHGAHWAFADWSLKKTDDLMMPTFCNYGRNYSNARDKYVYSYFIRFQSEEGPDDYPDKVDWLNCQKPGIIYLARVPENKILDRDAYAFFAGMYHNVPAWTSDIHKKKPVFENSNGVGWCMSVSYNSGLKRYILTTEHTETHRGNIGIFDAPEPWGPWTTVYYTKEEDHGQRVYTNGGREIFR